MKGFLGTGATFGADLNLVVQIAMGFSLLAGMILARNRRFIAHGICQTSVMLLNLVMIALVMWPSYRPVLPRLPRGLGDPYYRIATGHAALGTAAELLGLYIVVVAGTKIVPDWLRFKRWKIWMRTELALWWLVLLVGIGTYYVGYVQPAKNTRQPVAASGNITVKLTNFEFTPKEITIKVGSTMEWLDDTGRHSIVADDRSFQSEVLTSGGRFRHTFNEPGTVPYHCAFHGAAGKDMSGVVKVIR